MTKRGRQKDFPCRWNPSDTATKQGPLCLSGQIITPYSLFAFASSLDSKSSAARRLNFLIAVAAPALHSPKKTRRAM
jgi:hypothetical protein